MRNTASARIDLRAIRHNLAIVRKFCPHSRIMAMVKADAYGHGLVRVAKALATAEGLSVARLEEALQLRNAGITQRILLSATLLGEVDLQICAEQHIDVTAHDRSSVALIVRQASRTPLRVWLKLDSGMHRVGLKPEEFIKADRALFNHPGINELIHMTHFSSAGSSMNSVMESQMSCFSLCHEQSSKASRSLANSAALITTPRSRADWVRPGIMLYGDNPVAACQQVDLRTVMTLRSRVIAIREIDAGESVGYDGRWISERPSRIATVGIGYGDGYPRHARNGTPICIKGYRVPLVGRISMDSLTVDITDCGTVAVGDEAILWGAEVPVAVVAECAGTIPYELFTSVTQRVEREYIESIGEERLTDVG